MVSRLKNWYLGLAIWGVPARVVPRNYVKVFVSLLSHDIKHVAPELKPSKRLIFVWIHLGVLGDDTPKLCQNSFVLKISTDTQKNQRASLWC